MEVCDVRFGKKKAVGMVIRLPEAPMVLALGVKGYVMCGYLNLDAAEKFRAVAAVVRGIRSVEDLLKGRVAAVTSRARRLGVVPGMSGRQALKKFV